MAVIDKEFKEICMEVLIKGREYNNKKRGVKRLQIPSYTFKHSFSDGFPAITNKKLYWKGVVGELIWFLRGDNNVRFLNKNNIKFWNKDAWNWYVKNLGTKNFEEFEQIGIGSVGQNYGVQWRKFNGEIDQIQQLIDGMKADIMSSRLKVSAWNSSELNETALPPCHDGFQIIGVPLDNSKFGFELHWNQRSVDLFLGFPLNVASYSLLAKILEKLTGYKALGVEASLKCVHFYDNQYKAVDELLTRNSYTHENCTVKLPYIDTEADIDEVFNKFEIKDFDLIGYTSDKEIKVEMLAPKSI